MNGARSHFFDLPAPDWGVQFAIPDGPMCNPTLGGAEKRRLSFKQDKRRLVQELGGGSARPASCLKVTLALCPYPATMALARKPPGPRSIFHFFPPKGGGRLGAFICRWTTVFLSPGRQDGLPTSVADGSVWLNSRAPRSWRSSDQLPTDPACCCCYRQRPEVILVLGSLLNDRP